ncbi:MAG: hypothetical protein PVSMB11_12250 [Desulfuromonadaceae bacterium]
MRTLLLFLAFFPGLFLHSQVAQAAQMSSADYELRDSGTTNGGITSTSPSYQLRGAVRNQDGVTGQGTLYAVRGGILPGIQTGTSVMLGDITGDGKIDISDAYRMLEIAVGRVQPTANDLRLGDVAPLVNGKPSPDGVIDVADVAVILRRIVGLVNW